MVFLKCLLSDHTENNKKKPVRHHYRIPFCSPNSDFFAHVSQSLSVGSVAKAMKINKCTYFLLIYNFF